MTERNGRRPAGPGRDAPERSDGTTDDEAGGRPRRSLSALDGAVLVVGVVLGVGIFRSPPVVAANAADGLWYLGLWIAGGGISLVGALCYAELATAYPDAGGEYHLLSRAYSRELGFLVGWSRMTVIQTGSIAILAFTFGDYAAPLVELGPETPVILAAGAVVALTAINVAGLRQGRWAQYMLTGSAVAALALVVGAGFLGVPEAGAGAPPAPDPAAGTGGSAGLALVFVLLAYGGWSEGAYVSAEIRDRSRGIGRFLFWGTAAITVLYVLVNAAFLRALGLEGIAASDAVAARVMEAAAGSGAVRVVTLAVVFAALASANATVITGARSQYALGRDWTVFRWLGGWAGGDRQAPVRSLLVQGGIALLLVGFGAIRRSGFEAMVAYTAPVFWLVLLLTGAAVVVQRVRDPEAERPYRVPFYPLTPALFCAAAGYLLYSSVRHAGEGALLGLAVMAAGLPLLVLADTTPDAALPEEEPGSDSRTTTGS